ncbi:MAG: hypothetical protein KIS91_14770 [Anaerolineae bacterium]|nr:hypothetical protein [Anaerolineae bacterium]
MTLHNHFTSDEWRTLSQSPYAAMVAVMAVSPSGPMGLVQETLPLARSLSEIKANGSPSELIRTLVVDLTAEGATKPPAFGKTPEQAAQSAMQTLGLVGDLLSRKTHDGSLSTAEVDQFRAWLVGVADGTAHAYKEGGFLGIGKTEVSSQERDAVDNIRRLLGSAG